jgi:hypothetical protein
MSQPGSIGAVMSEEREDFLEAQVATLVEALAGYRDAVLDYSPRYEHDRICEIRTAKAGWKPGNPPVIQCLCGFEELGRATARVNDILDLDETP